MRQDAVEAERHGMRCTAACLTPCCRLSESYIHIPYSVFEITQESILYNLSLADDRRYQSQTSRP